MASSGFPVEQLLLKFGLDLSAAKQAGTQIKAILDELNKASKVSEDQAKTTADNQKQALSQLKASADAAIVSAKQAVAEKQAEVAATKAATEELRRQAQVAATKKAETIAETAELQRQVAYQREQTAEIQKQAAAIRLQRLEQNQQKPAGGGAVGIGALQSISRGLFGGGLAGGVATGVLAGGGLALIIEQAAEAIGRFFEKMKELNKEASRLSVVEDVFHRIAAGAGIDASKMTVDLTQKTGGLVDRLTLLKFANAGLQDPIRMTGDQITSLAGHVANLAEAANHTAQEGIDRLTHALSRGHPQMLANILDMQELNTINEKVGKGLSQTGRQAQEWAIALKMIQERDEKIGELPETFDRMQRRLQNAQKEVMVGFAKGFQESTGSQTFMSVVKGETEGLQKMAEKAEEFGKKIGEAMLLAIPIVDALKSAVGAIGTAAETAVVPFSSLYEVPEGSSGVLEFFRGLGNAIMRVSLAAGNSIKVLKLSVQILNDVLIKPLAAFLDTLWHAIVGLGQAMTGHMAAAKAEAGAANKSFASMGDWLGNVKQDFADFAKEVEHSGDAIRKFNQDIDKAQEKRKAGSKAGSPITPPPPPGALSPEELARLDQLDLQHQQKLRTSRIEQAKADLELKKDALAEDRAADQEAYREGEELLAEHLAKQHRMIVDANTLQQQEVGIEYGEAYRVHLEKRDEITKNLERRPQEDVSKQLHNEQDEWEAQEQGFVKKIEALEAQKNKDLTALDNEGARDRIGARKSQIQEELGVEEARIKDLQAVDAKRYEAGEEGFAAHFNNQLSYIKQLAEAQMQSARDIYEETKAKSATAGADLAKALQAIMGRTRTQLDSLAAGANQMTLGNITKTYGNEQGSITGGIQIQQQLTNTTGANTNAQQVALLDKMVQSLKSQRAELTQLLTQEKEGSDLWYQIADKSQKAYESQVKYQIELEKMRDPLNVAVGYMNQLAAGMQEVFQSKWGQDFASQVAQGAKELQTAIDKMDALKAAKTVSGQKLGSSIFGATATVSPEQQALQDHAAAMFRGVDAATKDLTSEFADTTDTVQTTVQSLQQFIQALQDASTALTTKPGTAESSSDSSDSSDGGDGSSDSSDGGGGGTQSAATSSAQQLKTLIGTVTQLANVVGNIMKAQSPVSGAAGGALGGASIGASFGPIGMAIGAAVGAITGGIVGAKNQAVTNNLNNAAQTYKNIMNQFAMNTNNLQATIVQMQQLMAQVAAEQASSKKGYQKYQDIIVQYTQEIKQLQAQQNQIIVQMNEQLATLAAPATTGLPALLQSLQSILQQYEQFAGAASSATELAQANQFLVASLQNYEDNLSQTLLQDNTQAIQDAIQLNDLQYQRIQLMQQYNDQVEGIMSQGVLTRQRTRAQTAGEQIEQANVTYNMQLEQMNEEIAAAQYKVQAEAQVFSIATTRIGLETQLLQLQNQQTNLSMQQIDALAQLVNAMQTGNLGNVPGLLALLAAVPASDTGTFGESADTLESMVASAYQDRASMGFGAYRSQNLG
jgi:outer membrane lipoprotein SlyB